MPPKFAGNYFAIHVVGIFCLIIAAPSLAADTLSADHTLTFERNIHPLLKANCFRCHGEDSELDREFDLRLRRLIVASGESGPAIIPENDLRQETEATKKMYGLDDPATAEYRTRCLFVRRFVELGVRFVQAYTGNHFWGHHGGIIKRLPEACKMTDKPAASLAKDIKSRGLLDTTAVHWGGEIGRLPVIENVKNVGRDHNTYGFSMWSRGGSFRGGITCGSTDNLEHKAVDNTVSHNDHHATLLHPFGLDAKELNYRPGGREQTRLDDQPHRIVDDILESA